MIKRSEGKVRYIYPFLLVLFICLSDTLNTLLYKDYYYASIVFIASLCFVFLPLYLLRNRLKLYLVYLSIPIIILPIKFACYIIYKVPFDESVILLIYNTNFQEASEMLSNYLWTIGIGVIGYTLTVYLAFVNRPAKVPAKSTKYISLSSLCIIFILPLIFTYSGRNYGQRYKRVIINSYPGSYLVLAKNIFLQSRLIFFSNSARAKFTFSARQDSISDQQVHVLIIGESCRYDHWGINGYSRNTSPRLEKRENLISFTNAASGGYITEIAVPLLLTGVGAENYASHFKQKSIVSAFNEVGFNSFWISNQSDRGNVTIHSSEAENQFFSLGSEHGGNSEEADDESEKKSLKNMDMGLVEQLKTILSKPGNKKFIVLHTLGSHFSYNARYPDNFDIYKPSYKTIAAKPQNRDFKNVLVNSYDNTILYSDMVVDSVISLVSKLNAFSSVTYMADHGEDLLDDDRNLVYHANPVPSKYVAHIPFFMWYSQKLAKKFPEKINNLNTHKTFEISSQDLIYTLTSLAGIRYPTQDSLKNIAGPYFRSQEPLIMGDKGIYKVSSLK
ncbi:MAG: phosphoethanolamine transferase [Mucilaginibacter sp.]